MASEKKATSPDSFESIVSQIESINKQLEANDVELGTALTLYQEGIRLTKAAQEHLKAAEQVVTTLSEESPISADPDSEDA